MCIRDSLSTLTVKMVQSSILHHQTFFHNKNTASQMCIRDSLAESKRSFCLPHLFKNIFYLLHSHFILSKSLPHRISPNTNNHKMCIRDSNETMPEDSALVNESGTANDDKPVVDESLSLIHIFYVYPEGVSFWS